MSIETGLCKSCGNGYDKPADVEDYGYCGNCAGDAAAVLSMAEEPPALDWVDMEGDCV